MVGRAATVIVALGMVFISVKAVTEDGPLALAAAVTAAAFASNLLRRLNPVLRMMSMAVQVLALLVMPVTLIGVSSTMGTSVPGSYTAAMVTAMILTVLAIAEGRRALRKR